MGLHFLLSSDFHFVAVMTIWKTRFKLDYANSTTESYLTMRDDVIAEVIERQMFVIDEPLTQGVAFLC